MIVLDHGYIRLVEHWGADEQIIEAARMSTGKGFTGWGPRIEHTDECLIRPLYFGGKPQGSCSCGAEEKPGDEKLLRYLWEHQHTSPFEMAGAIFEVKAPIFVFREWHRHRTQSYNEMSARYTPLPDENYVPSEARLRDGALSSGKNVQASSIAVADPTAINNWRWALVETYAMIQRTYEMGLAAGIPKELARLPVAVGRYSRMRASANLWNWLRFLQLRLAENAQWEIRQYAEAVSFELEQLFPRTLSLFKENMK